jgi:predicted N-acetyltransferase YhbS
MRQVAVLPSAQGHGIGTALVKKAEKVARQRGFKTMVLNARLTAVPFYLRLDYKKEGQEFIEVSLPHYKMSKELA